MISRKVFTKKRKTAAMRVWVICLIFCCCLMIPSTCMGLSLPSRTHHCSQIFSVATTTTCTTLSSTTSPYQQPEEQQQMQQQQQQQRPEDEDMVFHECCDMMEIEMPYASVRTTDESVAGRGVFCDLNRSPKSGTYDKDQGEDDLSSRSSTSSNNNNNKLIVPKGTAMIRIPAPVVLCTPTASQFFPETTQYIDESLSRISLQYGEGMSKQQHQSRTRRVVSKLGRGLLWPIRRLRNRRLNNSKPTKDDNTEDTIDLEPEVMEFADESDFWQIELTMYALECLQNHPDHPWTTWISQWRRDDPVQRLYEHQGGVTYRDKQAIEECVDELHALLPDANKLKLFAAVDIRLRRLEALKTLFRIDDDEVGGFDAMYGLVTSRAIGLGDGDEKSSDDSFSAIIPAFDMINHSPTSNLWLSFDEETNHFELIARRDIAHNEELFLTYTRPGTGTSDGTTDSWNEESAIWTLVQWGIPEGKKNKE